MILWIHVLGREEGKYLQDSYSQNLSRIKMFLLTNQIAGNENNDDELELLRFMECSHKIQEPKTSTPSC